MGVGLRDLKPKSEAPGAMVPKKSGACDLAAEGWILPTSLKQSLHPALLISDKSIRHLPPEWLQDPFCLQTPAFGSAAVCPAAPGCERPQVLAAVPG